MLDDNRWCHWCGVVEKLTEIIVADAVTGRLCEACFNEWADEMEARLAATS